MRNGIGYDIHRLIQTVEPSSIPIGGVSIPCFYRIEAHSDGDVVLHALIDACLGALALGDIGQWFPDTDPSHRGRPSSEFIPIVMQKLDKLGWHVAHFDCTVLLQEPKLAPHSDKIRLSIAQLLNVELSSVSIKAKTMEGLGPVGERKAIEAQAIVTLERSR